ncbi:hypothetical protein BJ875DRAFT_503024 [Amylocarpus encephaloides]|uniref:NACHT domain-containing protein n=1 Tax=Amylocarpus encephaloides TaxID=45428 RepID=A0A9P7YPN2_9HELO|nr:hypothetical protein BJ875DRAFT_503024 [Amylocarpus encephaloides]
MSRVDNYLEDLSTTNPREDKRRIEQTKGGLLKDSYRWILEQLDFQQWRDDIQRSLLWIKGDPGKGKTMLLCGIIDEMSRIKDVAVPLSYFFCQATDSRLNNATAVLRGLIYLLIDQQPSLISHVQKRYDQGGKNPFEDPSLQSGAYLIIDALDECETDLPLLLDLITQNTPRFPSVKWLVSSRNKPDIEARLRLDHTQQIRLSLELNEELFLIGREIRAKATGTFLWVALVLTELELVESWDVLAVLREMPPALKPLYHRMIQQIDQLKRNDPKFCYHILSTMILAYRPLHLLELGSLSSLPEEVSKSSNHITKVVNKCGSFLTIRASIVFFIHQSVKDYLFEDVHDKFFSSGIETYHYTIFSRSLQVMLKAPGISIDQVKQPDPDPLGAARYSCLYWVNHLLDCNTRGIADNDLKDSGSVYSILYESFLFWLEALSLMKSVSDGITMIKKLESLQFDESPKLHAIIYDARRFAIYNRSVIEQAPLRSYCSALIFSPEQSIVRVAFEKYIPSWVQRMPIVQAHWSAALQTLEGHSGRVTSVAFSPDGTQVVSGSGDMTVRLWDAVTGAPLQTLEGHFGEVTSVAFSLDGTQVISGSWDKTNLLEYII